MSIGENLKRIRQRNGISQGKLADMVNVSLHTIFRIENNKTQPRASDIKKLCEVLGVAEAELLNGPAKNEIEIRVIIEETDDWEVGVMDLTNNGKDRFSIHIGPSKIGVEVTGKFEKPEDLDNVFARARKCAEETLAAQERLVGI
jgi:transcriptional regulator with XRE-family HTH domain